MGVDGGTNISDFAAIQAAGTVVNNGGVVAGTETQHSAAGLPQIPVAAGAIPLPLGSSSPGSVNINTAADDITLAPGNYVVSNLNVNTPGAINVSPAGPVTIWVTGNLNLGGKENAGGTPANLTFIVTSAGFVNVNSGGTLNGTLYAPTSTVSVNSTIFGSVAGAAINMNSNGAVHYDSNGACAGAQQFPYTPHLPDPLPFPPTKEGCYVGTLNGWVSTQCADATYLSHFPHPQTNQNGIASIASSGTTVPFVYGQLESTVVDLKSSSDSSLGAGGWSVQLNTNGFPCTDSTGNNCLVQFVIQTSPNGTTDGNAAMCIWSVNNTLQKYPNKCVPGPDKIRPGDFVAHDFVNVAGYVFDDTSQSPAQHMLGMVVQYSMTPADLQKDVNAVNQLPGLYAVVKPDSDGLVNQWTETTGSVLGEGGGSTLTFQNAEVNTVVAASSCPGDTTTSGPTCPNQPSIVLSSKDTEFITSTIAPGGWGTIEKNNLTLIQTPTLSYPNADLVVAGLFTSTNTSGGTATCLASEPDQVFIKDNAGDNGGVPSNSGGVPFWESPDIFLLPAGSQTPGPNDVAADTEVVLGQSYDVYLRINNDYGCTSIGNIRVLIDGANPDVGLANWSPVTPNADTGVYTPAPGNPSVDAFSRKVIGPFHWSPDTSLEGGHKCLLAAIAAGNETNPAFPLTTAFSSPQIAQRNLQIASDSSCQYAISNTSSTDAFLLLGLAVSPAATLPGTTAVTLTFDDPGGTFGAAWTAQANRIGGNALTVTTTGTGSNTQTNVVLGTPDIALDTVRLPAGSSPNVSVAITSTASSGPAPTLAISSTLTDSNGNIVNANGASCTFSHPSTGVTCPEGLTLCGTTCVNISSDDANCGGCGVTCDGNCVEGICETIR